MTIVHIFCVTMSHHNAPGDSSLFENIDKIRYKMIPRIPWNSEAAADLIKRKQPVLLADCPLSAGVAGRWTLDYLTRTIDPTFQAIVFESDSTRFQYWSDSTVHPYLFTPPTRKLSMTFSDFERLTTTSSSEASPTTRKSYYLQQGLVSEMGAVIRDEFQKMSLDSALHFKCVGNWGPLTNNLLLVGQAGFISPCHYDEQENLFVQLTGSKRVRLFPPAAWHRLYPYPVQHPCDRQTQVVLPSQPGGIELEDHESREQFPAFREAFVAGENAESYADMQAGDVLYIPQYWFHQMEALSDNTSLSWWFKHQDASSSSTSTSTSSASTSTSTSTSTSPLSPRAMLRQDPVLMSALRRNLERLMVQMVGDARKAHCLLVGLAGGLIPLTAVPSATATTITNTNTLTTATTTTTTSAAAVSSSSACTSTDVEAVEAAVARSACESPIRLLHADVQAATVLVQQGLMCPSFILVVRELSQLVTQLLDAHEVPGFLTQLASGRFTRIFLQSK